MNTKNLVLMSLLVGVGAVLYIIIPGFNGGMKPDFMLTMMFIGILLFPEIKNVFLLGLSTGIISGLFSTFPGGFVPNIIDKLITALVFFGLVILLKKLANKLATAIVLTCIGTLVSGTVFLSTAIFIFNAGAVFTELFVIVVLPAVLINGIAFFIIYPIVGKLVRRSNFKTALTI
ncbi:tryptophan transporter [Psychrobacillus sp. FSL K6-2684]|uniref:tryptophan transporter n=1 Tax=unclassified Psychrobacillus TaxID=2636677 RepID=UPI0011A77D09|nr:tryptophan transporter [Psychrobacillus sp. AK 1817]QEY22312.1 tryptophan transporter [Psychrobacillus sp. AK 1817]QGM29199.1 tryptophan transporter [Bacillus sp. N3536]